MTPDLWLYMALCCFAAGGASFLGYVTGVGLAYSDDADAVEAIMAQHTTKKKEV